MGANRPPAARVFYLRFHPLQTPRLIHRAAFWAWQMAQSGYRKSRQKGALPTALRRRAFGGERSEARRNRAFGARRRAPVAFLAAPLRCASDIPCLQPTNPLDILPMLSAPLPPPLRALAPGFAGRFAAIAAGLVALVARAFLRHPSLAPLILPLCGRLNRNARRLATLMSRLARHGACRRRGEASGRGALAPRERSRTPKPPIPTSQAWLVRTLRHEAAGFASQLSHLLAEPGVSELLDAAPTARRLLRPLCRMLGIPDTPPTGGVARQATSDTPPAGGVARQAARRQGRSFAPRKLLGVFPFKNPESVLAPSPPPRTLRPPPCPRLQNRWPWNTKTAAKPA
jgi:hypothetical protein